MKAPVDCGYCGGIGTVHGYSQDTVCPECGGRIGLTPREKRLAEALNALVEWKDRPWAEDCFVIGDRIFAEAREVLTKEAGYTDLK